MENNFFVHDLDDCLAFNKYVSNDSIKIFKTVLSQWLLKLPTQKKTQKNVFSAWQAWLEQNNFK